MDGETREFTELLRTMLAAHGVDSDVDDTGLALRPWPRAHLKIAAVDRSSAHTTLIPVWLELDGLPPRSLYCHTAGWSEDPRAALKDAALQWMLVVFGPLVSYLKRAPEHGTDWFPAGHTYGLEGWHCFAGQCVIRASAEDRAWAVRQIAQQTTLASMIRSELSAALDPEQVSHGISLYVGEVGGQVIPEAWVGDVAHEVAGAALARFPFPDLPEGFTSVRQYVVAFRPQTARRRWWNWLRGR